MEERYKAEERKEIIGEEWRKISRIFDRWGKSLNTGLQIILQSRFLLIVFTFASLISTVWCIFTSPHFPDPDADEDRIAMTRR